MLIVLFDSTSFSAVRFLQREAGVQRAQLL